MGLVPTNLCLVLWGMGLVTLTPSPTPLQMHSEPLYYTYQLTPTKLPAVWWVKGVVAWPDQPTPLELQVEPMYYTQ